MNIGLGIGTRYPKFNQLSLALKAISAIRRNGGTLIGIPDNFAGAYIESNGTTPVTAVGDVIGKLNDRVGTNNATQPTTASKPVVTRVPKRTKGPVNQLLWSGDFSNALWQKANGGTGVLPICTQGAATTPTGQPASLVVLNKGAGSTTADISRVFQGVLVTLGQTYTQAVWLRTSDGTTKVLSIRDDVASIVNELFTVTPEWQLFVRSAAAGNTTSHTSIWLRGTLGTSDSASIHVAAALFTGTVTAQQILDNGGIPLTTTQPLPNVLEWTNAISFDGSNDFLQTGITTGNEGWICAGVKLDTTSSYRTIAHSGVNGGHRGVWLLTDLGRWVMSTNNGASGEATGYIAATTSPTVVSGGWDASTMILEVNGQTVSAPRSGNCAGSFGLRFGSTDTGTYPLPGYASCFIYTQTFPTEADRALIRKWVGSLQGQTL